MSTVQDPRRLAEDERGEPDLPDLGQWWSAVRRRLADALTTGDVWALRLVALHLVPVAALVVTGGLYIDDLRAQVYASGRSWWPFVIESNATHLAPSARTVDWLQATFAPLQHGPAVLVTLVVHAALGLAFWWVLRELGSARVAALPLLVLALLQPGVLPATAWFRQTLTTLSGLVLTLVAAALVLRAERTGHVRAAGPLAALAVGVGAGFSERALAAIPLAVALVVLRRQLQRTGESSTDAPRPRPAWRGVRWRAVLPAVGGMALMAAVFAVAYRSEEYAHGGGPSTDWLNLPRMAWRSFTRDVVPALLGGPWRWRPVVPSYGLADPPGALVVLANLVLLAVVVVALLRRRSRRATLGAIVTVAAYALPVWFLLFYGRFASGGLAATDDLRLWPDVGTVVLLLVAAVVGRRSTATDTRAGVPTPALVALAAATALVTAGGVVSWSGFAERWSENPASSYLATLQTSLPQRPGIVLPSSVPADVVPGWVQADLTTTDLVGLLDRRRLSTIVDGPALAVSPTGHVRPAVTTTRGRATAPPGSGFCGFSRPGTASGWMRVPFDQSVPYYRASMLRVPVLVNDTVTIRGRVVERDGRVVDLGAMATALPGGPHVLMVSLPYRTSVSALEVLVDEPAPLCVPSAEVVTVEAAR